MDHIMQAVSKAKRRLQQFRLWKYSLIGLIAGLVISALFLVAARLWPIPLYEWLAAAIAAAGLVTGFATGLLHRIPLHEAAAVMDASHAGQERSDMMVTALAFADSQSTAAEWQRKQAEEYGRKFMQHFRTRLPRPKVRRFVILCIAVLALVVLLVLLPSPMDQRLAEAAQEKAWVKEQKKRTDELAQQLQASKLEQNVRKPLEEELKQLQQRLDGQKKVDKALQDMEKTMKSIEKLAKQQEEKKQSLAELAKKMANTPQLASLGKSMEQGNKGDLQRAIKELKNKLQNMSEQEKDALRESLKKLAEEAAKKLDTKSVQDALNKLEQALQEGGDKGKLNEALKQLEEELAKALDDKALAAAQSAAAASISSALAMQGLSLASQLAASGQAVPDAWGSGGSAEMIADASQTGDDEMDSQDAAGNGSSPQASGTGGGKGTGTQGSGQGSGTGTGTGSGRGTGTQGGMGPGAGLGAGGRELVTTPRTMAGKGETHTESGPLQGGGGTVQKGGVSPVTGAASLPYEEVYEDYAAEAKKSLGRSDLPQQMQGLVEQYFTGINPNP